MAAQCTLGTVVFSGSVVLTAREAVTGSARPEGWSLGGGSGGGCQEPALSLLKPVIWRGGEGGGGILDCSVSVPVEPFDSWQGWWRREKS